MIKITKVYGAFCDHCDTQLSDFGLPVLDAKKKALEEAVMDFKWHLTQNGRCYCEDCCTEEYSDSSDTYVIVSKDTGKLMGISRREL